MDLQQLIYSILLASLSISRGQFPCVDSIGCVDASARCDGQKQCPTGSDEENCAATQGCLDSDWTCRNHLCIPKELRCNGLNDCLDDSDEKDCGNDTRLLIVQRSSLGLLNVKTQEFEAINTPVTDPVALTFDGARGCLMFWINAGHGDRVTVEQSWMDASERSTLAVLTAQSAHSLTADVAARRLYWISDYKKSIETVKVDGTGRYSFIGLFNRKPALGLAVFEDYLYWVDDKGLWQVPQDQPNEKQFIWKNNLPMMAVYHELQQPQDPRFIYATITSVNLLEFRAREANQIQLFTTDDGILSFDLDWDRDWLYWANQTGHVQRTSLTQVQVQLVPTSLPVCLIRIDQRTGKLYWVSCEQNIIGTGGNRYTHQLYQTTNEIRDIYMDWLRGDILWLEEDKVLSMSMMGGKAKELLHLAAGGVRGNIAFDVRAGSLLWNSERAGLTTMSLLKERSHRAGRRWNVSGSIVAAFEPFLLSLSDNVFTLWDWRDGSTIRDMPVSGDVLSVIAALGDITDNFKCIDRRSCVSKSLVCDGRPDCHDGSDEVDCPSAAPPRANLLKCSLGSKPCTDGRECVLYSHVCDGEHDCMDESDEQGCADFRCKDRRRCISKSLVCDGRPDCHDGSDEVDCSSAAPPRANLLKCSLGSKPCTDGRECVLYSHICDGEHDCMDESDEQGCGEFQCSHGNMCIPEAQVCDGKSQCSDRSDELDCWKPTKSCEHRCADGKRCIPKKFLCDGEKDCLDGTDEVGCASAPLRCRQGFKPCKDGLECVMYTHVCDGETDCQDGSDEEECVTQCKADEFRCAHGKRCIPSEQVCDGQSDCPDRSDEMDCSRLIDGCHRRCDNNTRCIPDTFLCDGERDCADGSDEEKCGVVACAVDQYSCLSGQCVSDALRCDGYADCRDRSDEAHCTRPPHCPTQLRCPGSHECLQKEWLCDGEDDCKDGSDEKNCVSSPAKCREHQWQCGDSSQCIPLSWRCDGRKDCHNNVDEANCSQRSCATQLYRCGSGECVDTSLVCNGLTNCADGSDEGEGCVQRNCSSQSAPQCDHHCVSTPNGPLMHTISQPAISNPCAQLQCSHLCLLAPAIRKKSGPSGPAAVCRCPKGLLLSKDKMTCALPKESTFILLLSRTTVYQIHLHAMRSDGLALKKLPNGRALALLGVTEASALDVRLQDLSLQHFKFWKPSLPHKDDQVTALAVDWVTSNLYWSSTARPNFHVTSRRDGYTTFLLKGSLKCTTSIALHPPSGRLCYTGIVEARGKDQTEVGCVWMDGRNKAVLWKKSSIPTSLVFSNHGTSIYWADMGESVISSIGVDGTGYKQYQTGPGLTTFTRVEDLLLWVTMDKDLTKLWFSDGLQPNQLWFETKTSVGQVQAYNNESQSGTNGCSINNGGCVQLCLPYPQGHTCKCGRGFYAAEAASCTPLPDCPAGEESCFDGSKCFSSSKFCDGKVDCPDRLDEQDCPSTNSSSFWTKSSDGRPPQSSATPHPNKDTKNSVLSVKKASPSCDLQHCSGQGRCVTEGHVTRCQCVAGYKGESCQQAPPGQNHVAVILGVFCLIAALTAAALFLVKRRIWPTLGSGSTEKETLMENMELPCEQYDSDCEELESPIDVRNPPLALKALQIK
ncbi:Low-density lipoprotein receptor-related protein 2 [Liparis tanakae]|uniref:Low-density lipoprotein receptor-related protein 2 n=1 Tax=Liparis tanakae TaxID=230148 RepID=A0A4Z2JA52_9TELE|nr:Low-density lipoprotein receptor-related protein 2 [Liparis tanakae]